ncbi:MAG: DUF4446 family protein [Patescibacteria group bacterium]|nr:DUF4446 family protein [Patescibacteria group bacterium]MDE1946176.1 DUF4446 family protein [Patescibacteria group bacterium]
MNFTVYAAAGAAIIILLLLVWIIRLEIVLRKLLKGKTGTLDDAISTLRGDIADLKKYSAESAKHFEVLDAKMKKTVSGNETVRFNPFKGDGSGGNQSFATALLNADGDGVIISSMYSRDHVSVFAKPVKKLSSDYELSAEERDALTKAKGSIL